LKYSPADIKAYKIDNNKYYVSKNIEINDTKKQVFLEFLVDGIVNLYYLNGEEGDFYYIEKDGRLIKLSNDKELIKNDGSTYVKYSQQYKGVLRYLFQDSPEIQDDINRAQFDYKPLIKLTREYHNYVCSDYECIDYSKSTAHKIFFEPAIGIVFSGLNLHTSSDHAWSVRPALLLNLRILPLKSFNRLHFITGLTYSSVNFGGDFHNYIYDNIVERNYRIFMKFNYLSIPVNFEFMLSAKKIQPFVSLGFSSNFIIKPDYSIASVYSVDYKEEDYVLPLTSVYRKFQVGFGGGLGVKYALGKGDLLLKYNSEYRPPIMNVNYILDYSSITAMYLILSYQVQL